MGDQLQSELNLVKIGRSKLSSLQVRYRFVSAFSRIVMSLTVLLPPVLPLLLLLLLGDAFVANSDRPAGGRSFEIANDSFYKDGEPFRILGGDLHYFRVHPQYWEDRLLRAKALGLNVIQTYVPWNLHQPRPDRVYFEGHANLEGYLELIQKLDMLVMVRIGPYICGEWDFGGFPSWLLGLQPELKLRSSDSRYLNLVDGWWDELLPKLVPFLYREGGPIIMIQVENEYGSFGMDKEYIRHLVAKAKGHLGEDVILYTTDGAVRENLKHGSLGGGDVYTVVDFPVEWDAESAFALQKQFNSPGQSPPLSSEFYTGWLTHWGEPLAQTDPYYTAAALDRLLKLNASVVLYMVHGGSNFGFSSGANTGGSASDFQPDITSYDYDAPIGEAGDITSGKFEALKTVIAHYSSNELPDAPPLPPRKAFGKVELERLLSIFQLLHVVSEPPHGIPMDQPCAMEILNQESGFILYRTILPSHTKRGSKLAISQVHDRAQVYIVVHPGIGAEGDNKSQSRRMHIGTVERWSNEMLWLPDIAAVPGLQLDILVENMGRVNYGPYIYDPKGITSTVLLDDTPILGWVAYPIPLQAQLSFDLGMVTEQVEPNTNAMPADVDRLAGPGAENWTEGPSFYQGFLSVDEPADTFLSLVGWSKGIALLNGFNLGRYWQSKGPQCTLYIPAPLLHAGLNELILFELDDSPQANKVAFTDVADFTCGLKSFVGTGTWV